MPHEKNGRQNSCACRHASCHCQQLKLEVHSYVVGNITVAGCNTCFGCGLLVEAVTHTNSHSLFVTVTTQGCRGVEFTHTVRLEQTGQRRTLCCRTFHFFVVFTNLALLAVQACVMLLQLAGVI